MLTVHKSHSKNPPKKKTEGSETDFDQSPTERNKRILRCTITTYIHRVVLTADYSIHCPSARILPGLQRHTINKTDCSVRANSLNCEMQMGKRNNNQSKKQKPMLNKDCKKQT